MRSIRYQPNRRLYPEDVDVSTGMTTHTIWSMTRLRKLESSDSISASRKAVTCSGPIGFCLSTPSSSRVLGSSSKAPLTSAITYIIMTNTTHRQCYWKMVHWPCLQGHLIWPNKVTTLVMEPQTSCR